MMVRNIVFVSCIVSLFLLSSACRSSRGANVTDSQYRSTHIGNQQLDVLIDEGNTADMNVKQVGLRNELRMRMESDLPRKMARQGIDMRFITSLSQNTGAAGSAPLLIVRYDVYNPGSTAARMVVGFGAGAASLDISLSLCKDGKEVQGWKDGCGTSQHWSRLINTLDDRMSKRTKELLFR
ncbi:MAG: DUF4410 domain-containing protein [bacterium]